MSPMYLVYQPPQMLPTQTLNPTAIAYATGKAKRSLLNDGIYTETLSRDVIRRINSASIDQWWWIGVVMTFVGGIVLVCS
jgi:hypothetical protein